jgi:Flp pilus assembly protein TadD
LQALAEVAWQPEAEKRYKTGLKLMVAGQLARAVSQLQAALLVQSHAKIYQALGLAYERSGQTASAVEAYRVILRMPAAHDNLVQGARQRLQELGAGPVDFD